MIDPEPRTTPQRSERERTGGFIVIGAMVILMWLVETIDIVAGNLDDAGIHPRDVDGLPGIAASPFLHAGFGHLIGNTLPFLVLGAAIAVGGLMRTLAVVGIIAVVGGLGTWLTAPSNTVVIVIYGSTLLTGLVPTPGISWQGHLFGAIGGLVAARVLHRARRGAAQPV